jgi:hypothetical protein
MAICVRADDYDRQESSETSHGVPQCPSFGEAPLKPRDPVVNDGCLGTDYNLLILLVPAYTTGCGFLKAVEFGRKSPWS